MRTALEYLALAEDCRTRAMDGRPKLAKDHLLGAADEFDRLAREELDKARVALRAPFSGEGPPPPAPGH